MLRISAPQTQSEIGAIGQSLDSDVKDSKIHFGTNQNSLLVYESALSLIRNKLATKTAAQITAIHQHKPISRPPSPRSLNPTVTCLYVGCGGARNTSNLNHQYVPLRLRFVYTQDMRTFGACVKFAVSSCALPSTHPDHDTRSSSRIPQTQ